MCISASPFGMGVFAAECAHTYENVTSSGSFAYYGCAKCGTIVDTKPVIFFSTKGGDNANDGFTADKPVKTIVEAFKKLAEYKVGGTAVMCGQTIIDSSAYHLEDAVKTVTVTSYYNNVDYRATNKACLVVVQGLYVYSDVVFDNVSFVTTSYAKPWYLQYNDLTISSTCGMFENKGGFSETKLPVVGDATTSYCINVTTGYRLDSLAAKSNKSDVEQTVIIDGACFNVLVGNKTASTALNSFGHTAGPDTSLDNLPAARTNIYIGEGASVGAIDLFPVNNQSAKVYFTDGRTDISYQQYAGGAAVASSAISGYNASNTYALMNMQDENAAKPEEMIHVMDADKFVALTPQKRENPVPNPAIRVPFTVSAAWVDDASAPVVELGVLMALEANADKLAYQIANGKVGGTVGKSVSYDETRNDYYYAGGDAPVKFYGVLEYEVEGYEYTTFSAAPYGVVSSAAIGGKYTLLGETVSFAYDFDNSYEYLDELDILEPYDGDKLKIACIGDSITQGTGVTDKENFSYPAQLQALLGNNYVVGNFGKGGSYVLKFESEYNTGHNNPALSYKSTAEFPASIAFKPDVVVIMLGTNDMRNMTSDGAKAEFKDTLRELVETYEVLPSVKKIYLCSNIHALSSAMAEQLSSGEMTRLVRETAKAADCGFIDVNAVTFEYMSVYMNTTDDKLHPGKEGYLEIAKAMEAGIRGTEADITVPTVSDTGVVYVREDGAVGGKGASYETAVKDFAAAVALLRKSGGTVVVCGPVNIDYNTFLPDTDARITVTSVYGGVDYRTTKNAKLNFSKTLYLGGDFTFDGVDVHASADSTMLVCNYHNVTIGSDVNSTKATTSIKFPVFVVGINVGNEGTPDSEIDFGGVCNIEINGGEWNYIRGGNRRQSATYPIGRVLNDASVTVTVNGGTFYTGGSLAPSIATGMNSVYGTCSFIINGGTFNGDVCAVGRVAGTNGVFETETSGTVNLVINGGTITGSIKAIFDSSANVTGDVNLTCASAYQAKVVTDNFTTIQYK